VGVGAGAAGVGVGVGVGVVVGVVVGDVVGVGAAGTVAVAVSVLPLASVSVKVYAPPGTRLRKVQLPDDPKTGAAGFAIVVSHGPPSAEPALLRPILATGVDWTLAQVTVTNVPLAEAVNVGADVALTVNVVVPTDPPEEKNNPDAPE
jgi:hypothetical protein